MKTFMSLHVETRCGPDRGTKISNPAKELRSLAKGYTNFSIFMYYEEKM